MVPVSVQGPKDAALNHSCGFLQVAAWSHQRWGLPAHAATSQGARAAWPSRRDRLCGPTVGAPPRPDPKGHSEYQAPPSIVPTSSLSAPPPRGVFSVLCIFEPCARCPSNRGKPDPSVPTMNRKRDPKGQWCLSLSVLSNCNNGRFHPLLYKMCNLSEHLPSCLTVTVTLFSEHLLVTRQCVPSLGRMRWGTVPDLQKPTA